MDEGFSAILSAHSTPGGAVAIELQSIGGAGALHLPPVVLSLTVRLIDMEIVRVSVTNPATGSVAYFQGALPAISLAREIGLDLSR